MAAETFMRNLIQPQASDLDWEHYLSLSTTDQVDKGLVIADVETAFSNTRLRRALRSEEIDLIVGGPPCQGFSLAGRRDPRDKRNSLAWNYLDYVQLCKPKFVIIENVLGMNARFSKGKPEENSIFSQLAAALEETGPKYVVQKLQLNARHYGAAQNRERLFLVGCRRDVAKHLGLSSNNLLWKSDFKNLVSALPDLAPLPTEHSNSQLTVRDAIGDLCKGGRKSHYVENLRNSKLWGLPPSRVLENNNPRNHNPRSQLKFELYLAIKRLQLNPLLMRSGLIGAPNDSRNRELARIEKMQIFPILGSRGQILAPSFSSFIRLLEEHRTRKHSQRVLEISTTPPTVITSPDDYIHPLAPRVLTVRELARFQGFSDDFVFYSKETTGGLKRRTEIPQYSQVGNAVSPFVSRALGLRIRDLVK
jgi:DNA (cytosine-5)-methyltransferase 1